MRNPLQLQKQHRCFTLILAILSFFPTTATSLFYFNFSFSIIFRHHSCLLRAFPLALGSVAVRCVVFFFHYSFTGRHFAIYPILPLQGHALHAFLHSKRLQWCLLARPYTRTHACIYISYICIHVFVCVCVCVAKWTLMRPHLPHITYIYNNNNSYEQREQCCWHT